MKEWLSDHKLYAAVLLFILLGGFYYAYNEENQVTNQSISQLEKRTESEPPKTQTQPSDQPKTKKTDVIVVDVKGSVKQPGVYQSSLTERVNDVISHAGGLTEEADASQVNFAAHVQDEMVIYVPKKGEAGPSPPLQAQDPAVSTANSAVRSAGEMGGGKINLNKADETELETLPGIGPAKASAILDYRKQNGMFQSVEDLKKISGIGDKTFEKLKDLISVQ